MDTPQPHRRKRPQKPVLRPVTCRVTYVDGRMHLIPLSEDEEFEFDPDPDALNAFCVIYVCSSNELRFLEFDPDDEDDGDALVPV